MTADNPQTPPRRRRLRLQPKVSSPPKALYLATLLYLVITYIRPQDLLSPLALLQPGLLALLAVGVSWLWHRPKSLFLDDPIVRAQLIFMVVTVGGLFVVVNHRFWFNMTQGYIESFFVYSLVLPVVMQNAEFGKAILRLLLVSFLFIATWVITHDGVGTAAWMTDENDAAAVLIIGASLGYATWAESTSVKWRWLGAVTGILCVAGVVATQSRGGFLGLVAAAIAMTVFSRAFIKSSVLIVLGVVAALPIVPEHYFKEIESISDKTDSTRIERIYSWGRAWDMFVANPVIGVGAGNFPWQVNRYEQSREATLARAGGRQIGGRAAHSLYFTLISETGGIGALAYLFAVGIALRRAWRINRAPPDASQDPSVRVVAAWLGPGLFGFSIAAAFISVLWYPPVWLFIGLGVFLGTAQSKAPGARSVAANENAPRRPIAGTRPRA